MADAAADTVTISKAEWDKAQAIVAMTNKAWDDKTVGAGFRKALKAVNPDLKLPDDLADSVIAPVNAKLEETEKQVKGIGDKLDKYLAETKDKEETADMHAKLADATKKFGLDDEGRTKMIERMKATNSFDPEAAAAWVAHQAPKPKPITDHGFTTTGANLFGSQQKDDKYADLYTGGDPFRPGGFFEKEANAVMNEMAEQAA